MPTYKTAFPDFGVLDVELPKGFVDVSEWDDACPSFKLSRADNNEETLMLLYVDYADVSMREMSSIYKRFTLYNGDDKLVCTTEHWSEMLAAMCSMALPT